ncbi:HAD family hydrolase [Catellatospora sichuanensis]|uniref:HAD family hydrolase n=1 Tax=Catellatospora sichuanensis TaxID=1969805 RepID=UPI001183C2CE|nr:HAD family phosphatase [Catellatospora sichuanensis]
MTGTPAALLVDYGGVLTERMDLTQSRFCQAAGIEPGSLLRVLDEWVARPGPDSPVPAMERGEITVAAFERLLAARLTGIDGVPVRPDGLLQAMFADGRLDEQTLDLVAELRRAGVRTAMVSNAWGSDYPFDRLHACFDAFVLSHEVGSRKPEPDIYLRSAQLLDVAPQDCVFVDDRAANVHGAQLVGMVGLHFTDPAAGRARLRELFDHSPHR